MTNLKIVELIDEMKEDINKKRNLSISLIDLITVEEWLNRIKKANK